MNDSTISILGCGWLGAPLARNLMAEGYHVKGSTRQAEKKTVMKDVGIKPYLLTLTPELSPLNPEDFFQADLLIIAIPPLSASQEEDFHARQIKAVAAEINKHSIKKCIYISSIAAYPEADKEISEEDLPEEENSPQPGIRKAENILQNINGLDLAILRCGELYGYNRIPGNRTGDHKGIKEESSAAVNYIHRDDVIGVILEILRQNYWNQILNVVAPNHPRRQVVYLHNSKNFGFEVPPHSQDKTSINKIVSSKKLQKDLHYQFLYPDPLHFRYT